MPTLIVVDNPRDWPLEVAGIRVVAARTYLADLAYNELKRAKVFNLCRSYRYQSTGYYVSLLAAARGHKPLPNVTTIQDLKSHTIVRILSEELEAIIQRSLAPLQSDSFTLSIYFGRNMAKRYDRLSLRLFNLFQAPLLRAHFVRNAVWQLQSVRPIAANDIPQEHGVFVVQAAGEYFAGRRPRLPQRAASRYDMAILHDPNETEPPSNARALRLLNRAAARLGFNVDFITRDDYARLAEYDALLIRTTTNVNHYTYRFARRAAAEGLVVLDDPASILKCCNKVYLAELLRRHGIRIPKTLVVHRGNVATIAGELGLPCVLKQPDSSFSQGVVKVERAEELADRIGLLLSKSDLVVAQEFLPTDFDWRVGVCDRQPIFVCKYFMARQHWQIVKRDTAGRKRSEGLAETLCVEEAPRRVVRTAVKAANLIGDGLYGVDLKEVGRRLYVMEINDNPNIDAGVEDAVLKDELYTRLVRVFLERIERRAQAFR